MTLYRGSNTGITEMVGGSFYTRDYETAKIYSEMEQTPEIYEFNSKLNLLQVDGIICCSDIDEGIETIIEELIDLEGFKGLGNINEIMNKYDGIESENSCQIVLFGTLDINDNFKKQNIEVLLKDGNCQLRKLNR